MHLLKRIGERAVVPDLVRCRRGRPVLASERRDDGTADDDLNTGAEPATRTCLDTTRVLNKKKGAMMLAPGCAASRCTGAISCSVLPACPARRVLSARNARCRAECFRLSASRSPQSRSRAYGRWRSFPHHDASLFRIIFHESVIRKLSSLLCTICSNRFAGTAKVSRSSGTLGRADTSNMPRTQRGCSDCASS